MDKISGILPSTARISSVDVKEAGPVRPGLPAFGRTEVPVESRHPRSEVRADSASTAQKSSSVSQEMSDWRTKDSSRAALVADLNDKFFNRTKPAAKEEADESEHGVPVSHVPSVLPNPEARTSRPAGFKNDEMRALRDAQMEPVDGFGSEEREGRVDMPRKQPEGLYPRGSFLDRTA